jgi:hypothetical protein
MAGSGATAGNLNIKFTGDSASVEAAAARTKGSIGEVIDAHVAGNARVMASEEAKGSAIEGAFEKFNKGAGHQIHLFDSVIGKLGAATATAVTFYEIGKKIGEQIFADGAADAQKFIDAIDMSDQVKAIAGLEEKLKAVNHEMDKMETFNSAGALDRIRLLRDDPKLLFNNSTENKAQQEKIEQELKPLRDAQAKKERIEKQKLLEEKRHDASEAEEAAWRDNLDVQAKRLRGEGTIRAAAMKEIAATLHQLSEEERQAELRHDEKYHAAKRRVLGLTVEEQRKTLAKELEDFRKTQQDKKEEIEDKTSALGKFGKTEAQQEEIDHLIRVRDIKREMRKEENEEFERQYEAELEAENKAHDVKMENIQKELQLRLDAVAEEERARERQGFSLQEGVFTQGGLSDTISQRGAWNIAQRVAQQG